MRRIWPYKVFMNFGQKCNDEKVDSSMIKKLLAALIINMFIASAIADEAIELKEVPTLINDKEASTMDLADTPPLFDFVSLLVGIFTDASLQNKFNKELNGLVQQVGHEIADSGHGYLIRVEVYSDSDGGTVIPSGRFLYPIGTGKRPIDAMADSMRSNPKLVQAPANTSPPASSFPDYSGLKDKSYFLWIEKDEKQLKAYTIPPEFKKSLMSEARDEAKALDRATLWADSSGQKQKLAVKRADFWQKYADSNDARIKNSRNRQQIKDKLIRMAELQNSINKNYDRLQDIKADMAKYQSHMRILQGVQTVLNVAEAGVSVGKLYSGPSDQSSNTDSPNKVSVEIERTESQINGYLQSKVGNDLHFVALENQPLVGN